MAGRLEEGADRLMAIWDRAMEKLRARGVDPGHAIGEVLIKAIGEGHRLGISEAHQFFTEKESYGPQGTERAAEVEGTADEETDATSD